MQINMLKQAKNYSGAFYEVKNGVVIDKKREAMRKRTTYKDKVNDKKLRESMSLIDQQVNSMLRKNTWMQMFGLGTEQGQSNMNKVSQK